MTKHHECIERLVHAGFVYEDACALRRIAMTLHRWHELECGDGNDNGSWCVVRGKHPTCGTVKHATAFEYDDSGAPYLEYRAHFGKGAIYSLIADRERGAQKRLARIMARYPGSIAYVQGDPRGASLYICNRATTPLPIDANYNRGIAVYR